jgi:hypothetical protein
MKRFTTILAGALVFGACISCPAQKANAQSPAPAAMPAAATPDPQAQKLAWPRKIQEGDSILIIYQPQVETWNGNQISGRAAISVSTTAKEDNANYGVIWFTARTEVDKSDRMVLLQDAKIDRISLPSDKAAEAAFLDMARRHVPTATREIPLDHLEAALAASQSAKNAAAVPVKNDPPQIIYSTAPALLVLIDGDPALRQVPNSPLMRVVNTRALILFDPSSSRYYLHAVNRWLSANAATGPWMAATAVPMSLDPAMQSLAASKTVDLLDPADPQNAPKTMPIIYVNTKPAELIQTEGEPEYVPIPDTKLFYVKNTDSALFMDTTPQRFYVLVSGRWFVAPAFTGPWTFVPGKELPPDFTKIPQDNPKANVLVSVPGTTEAQEAVIANSIPQTAAVRIADTHVDVTYDGQPKFVSVQEAPGLSYATNTAVPVIEINDAKTYWCVQNGVWFTAASPLGPWVVATTVPGIIYTIPVSSPIHYVTYVQVYSSTPQVVYVGYTPGYMGTCVSTDGVVVYGTGYYYPAYVGTVWVGYPPTYGYGAGFSCGMATGFAFGFAAGAIIGSCWSHPYWGPCGWGGGYSYAHVDINSTSVYHNWGGGVTTVNRHYGYNGATGETWSSGSAHSFNPYTGRQSAAGYNSYSNAATGNYAAREGAATYNPNTGIVRGGGASVSGNAYNGTANVNAGRGAYNTKTNTGVGVYDNNVYASHDGNVYRYNQNSGWEQKTNSGWQDAQRNSNFSQQQTQLNSERNARYTGQQRFQNYHASGGGRFRR